MPRHNNSSLIKKVEIKRFRSFDKVVIDAGALNIYSGRNNSGKSNILKALNLFFNQKSNYNTPYNHEEDYNKAFRGAAGGRRAIEITIHFWPSGNGALKEEFWVKRTFIADSPVYEEAIYSKNQKIQEKINLEDGNTKRQFTRFLNSIEYIYIPAVRDKNFVKMLLLNFEAIIKNDIRGEDFDQKINELSDILSEKSIGISKEFEKFIGLPATATLSSNTQDVLGAVDINVSSGIQIKYKKQRKVKGGEVADIPINLFSSGDGVVMSYLVFFLAYLTKKTNKKFIWGFEEPENSLEFSKVQKLAEEFYSKFAKTAQIFITTHSPAFISLKDREDVEFYRVYILPQAEEDREAGYPDKHVSSVEKLEQIKQSSFSPWINGDTKISEALDEELHLVEQAQEIEKALKQLEKERYELSRKSKDVDKIISRLDQLCPKKIFICEDETAKQFWTKLLVKIGTRGITVMSSGGVRNDIIEKWASQQEKLDSGYVPIIWREADLDGFLPEQREVIERRYNGGYHGRGKYNYSMLPFNEIENILLVDSNLVSDEDFNSMQDDIKDAFDKTASDNLNICNKYIADDKKIFPFGGAREHILMFQKMRKEAMRDWRRYMPGKDIIKRKGNINALAGLESLTLEQLPAELVEYLNRVKEFFTSQ